jgi:hypothetical protein
MSSRTSSLHEQRSSSLVLLLASSIEQRSSSLVVFRLCALSQSHEWCWELVCFVAVTCCSSPELEGLTAAHGTSGNRGTFLDCGRRHAMMEVRLGMAVLHDVAVLHVCITVGI